MSRQRTKRTSEIPEEIDFRRATRGLHHIPPEKRVLLPISVDKEIWEILAARAAAAGVTLSEVATSILQREIRTRPPAEAPATASPAAASASSHPPSSRHLPAAPRR